MRICMRIRWSDPVSGILSISGISGNRHFNPVPAQIAKRPHAWRGETVDQIELGAALVKSEYAAIQLAAS